jgi:hypothetical protein
LHKVNSWMAEELLGSRPLDDSWQHQAGDTSWAPQHQDPSQLPLEPAAPGSDGVLERARQLIDSYGAQQEPHASADATSALLLGEPLPGSAAALESLWADPPSSEAVHSLVVIDTAVANWRELVVSAPAGAAVLVLDPNANGVQQIAEHLGLQQQLGKPAYSNLALVSEGAEGRLLLGNGELSSANLSQQAEALQRWGLGLTAGADLLLFGCNVAAGALGASFVQQLASLSGTDVAASSDLTGRTGLGGDLDLEVQQGAITGTQGWWSTAIATQLGAVLDLNATANEATPTASTTGSDSTSTTTAPTTTATTVANAEANSTTAATTVSPAQEPAASTAAEPTTAQATTDTTSPASTPTTSSDATLATTVANAEANSTPTGTALTTSSTAAGPTAFETTPTIEPARQLIVIDASVPSAEELIADIPPEWAVLQLTADRNGLQELANALAGRSDLQTIHLFSHGDVNRLTLGNVTLSEAELTTNAALLAAIGTALSSDGEILLYGFDGTEGLVGQSFVDALARATGVDIAASQQEAWAAIQQQLTEPSAQLTESTKVLLSTTEQPLDPNILSFEESVALASAQAPEVDPTRQLVVVDASVPFADELIAGIPPEWTVLRLTADRNGLEQIAAALAGRSGMQVIHIFSHGGDGRLTLGSATVSEADISANAAALAAIGAALSSDGDILLYGCDVAEGFVGQSFVDALARATGADVAASVAATWGSDSDHRVSTWGPV